jgi:hypothetical protein
MSPRERKDLQRRDYTLAGQPLITNRRDTETQERFFNLVAYLQRYWFVFAPAATFRARLAVAAARKIQIGKVELCASVVVGRDSAPSEARPY